MTSSTPDAPDPGTQVDFCLTCGDSGVLPDLSGWNDYGHYCLCPAGRRQRRTDAKAFNDYALARQSPTVALTNDRDEERER